MVFMNRISASDFFKFFHCPHWAYFDWHATPEQRTEYRRNLTEEERQRQDDGVLHEKDVVADLFAGENLVDLDGEPRDLEAAFRETLDAMKAGADFIYQGTLLHGDWVGRPDILEKRMGKSDLGDWHYMSVDVKSSHTIKKYQKFQLTFYAFLLEKIQGRLPSEGAIVNIDHHRLPYAIAEDIPEFNEVLGKLEEIRRGRMPDSVLRKTCFDVGLWGELCKRIAVEQDDISQLYKVNVKQLDVMRACGIRTVTDAAGMDPEAVEIKSDGALSLRLLQRAKMQALSLKHGTVFIRNPVALPTAGLEIHFDIESSPGRDMDYLYGFLIRGGQDTYKSFTARSDDGEEGMWREFMAWIETLPDDLVVYHYAAYEKSRLTVLAERYGGSEALDRFREKMIDLSQIVSDDIVFPLYFYGLKQVAPFLGFAWSGDVKGGAASINHFENYLKSKDEKLMRELLVYNEDDVRATAMLKDWLVTYAVDVKEYQKPYPWAKE